jgi:hypothetical protein
MPHLTIAHFLKIFALNTYSMQIDTFCILSEGKITISGTFCRKCDGSVLSVEIGLDYLALLSQACPFIGTGTIVDQGIGS